MMVPLYRQTPVGTIAFLVSFAQMLPIKVKEVKV
jgi:hypothetical protein